MPIDYKKICHDIDEKVNLIPISSKTKQITADALDLNSIQVEYESDENSYSNLSIENIDLEQIETKYGSLIVGKQTFSTSTICKNQTKQTKQTNNQIKLNSIIITFHDIGFHHESNFVNFFSSYESKIMLKNFIIYHINAPGQHHSCRHFKSSFVYPTMDQLSEIVQCVIDYYKIENFVAFAQGAGANVMLRYAIKKPNKVNGLFLINPIFNKCSWLEWVHQRRNIKLLQNKLKPSLFLNPIVQDYLIWHHFGKSNLIRKFNSFQAIQEYRYNFKKNFTHAFSLSLFIESYLKRTFINLTRTNSGQANQVTCECLIFVGDLWPHKDNSNQLFQRLAHENSNLIKLNDCSNPLLEQPDKVRQAFKFFLLGLGFTIKSFNTKLEQSTSFGQEKFSDLFPLVDFDG